VIQIRKSEERGRAEHGWLKSYHSFSFADYYDENFMGWGALRVINEDWIQGGMGFGTHGHRDMEIITYILEGALEHKDSMGTVAAIHPGEVQRMSAGTGVRHSEYNKLQDKNTHLLQIWILPEKEGVTPSYEQKSFEKEFATGDLVLVASQDGRGGSVKINQDAQMYVCNTKVKGEKTHTTTAERYLWVQVVKGTVSVDGHSLGGGDAAALKDVSSVKLSWTENSEFILFDLPS
jgi:quercetin 2,3-dioxygenase